jgi:hypothetical protein
MTIEIYSYKDTFKEKIWQGRSEEGVFYIRYRGNTLGIGFGKNLEEAVIEHFKVKIKFSKLKNIDKKDLEELLSKIYKEEVCLK